ncbi:DsbA family protein [Candidatus Berkelbacteria bacterium]|nr:DsbA family protein [Candidatus Berkelbacteria bacterium]
MGSWGWTLAALGIIGLVVGIAFFDAKQVTAPVTIPQSVAEVATDEWSTGNESARVTLIEYGDFQCPACRFFFELLRQLKTEFPPQELRVIYRHFPLDNIHSNARAAAHAAEAAGEQGKFFPMHDLLYERQPEWSELDDPTDVFATYAEDLGLDLALFRETLDRPETKEAVQADVRSGNVAQVTATPTFILNGKKIDNPNSYDTLRTLVRTELGQ